MTIAMKDWKNNVEKDYAESIDFVKDSNATEMGDISPVENVSRVFGKSIPVVNLEESMDMEEPDGPEM